MRRAVLRTAVATTGIAVGVWLLPASVHIVSWESTGPGRIALLASSRVLAVSLAAAATIVGGVIVAHSVFGPRVSDGIAAALGPWALIWLWVVPYLPWLPDRAPLLLVLSGPLR